MCSNFGHGLYHNVLELCVVVKVSIDSRIREIINRNMVNPDTKTFEEAQNQIYQLMKRDSYHRFINSPFFKSLEQNAKNCPSPPPSAQSQPPTSQHTPTSLSGASSGGHPGTTPGSSASSNSNNTKNNSSSSNRSPLSAQNNSAAGGGDPHKGSNLGRTTTTTTGEDSGGSSVNSSKPTANSNSGKWRQMELDVNTNYHFLTKYLLLIYQIC